MVCRKFFPLYKNTDRIHVSEEKNILSQKFKAIREEDCFRVLNSGEGINMCDRTKKTKMHECVANPFEGFS